MSIALKAIGFFGAIILAAIIISMVSNQPKIQVSGYEPLSLHYSKALLAQGLVDAKMQGADLSNISIEYRQPAGLDTTSFYRDIKESFAVSGYMAEELRALAGYYGCTINSMDSGSMSAGIYFTLNLSCDA